MHVNFVLRLTTHGTEENCLLSDVPIRDLRPGLDYISDDNHVLYAWKDLDPYCAITSSIDDDHVFGGSNPLKPLLPDHSRPDFSPDRYPSTRPDDIYSDPKFFFTKPGGYGVRPFDSDKPVRPSGSHGYDGDKFGYGIRPSGFESFYRK